MSALCGHTLKGGHSPCTLKLGHAGQCERPHPSGLRCGHSKKGGPEHGFRWLACGLPFRHAGAHAYEPHGRWTATPKEMPGVALIWCDKLGLAPGFCTRNIGHPGPCAWVTGFEPQDYEVLADQEPEKREPFMSPEDWRKLRERMREPRWWAVLPCLLALGFVGYALGVTEWAAARLARCCDRGVARLHAWRLQ